MRKEIIQTGKTVEEAIQTGCLLLGVSQQDCDIEIIDLPKSSFFGLKKTPAKVKISIEVAKEDLEIEISEEKKEVAKDIPQQRKRAVEKKIPIIKEQSQAKPTAVKEKHQQTAQPVVEKQKSEPQSNIGIYLEELSLPEAVSLADAGLSEPDQEKVQVAVDYVKLIADGAEIDYTIETRYEDGTVVIGIYGKSLGVLIGRRGETLNAIQYLTGLVANRLDGDYLRISVDVGDYRKKCNVSLREMALKAAEEVLRTNVSRTLESMNPAERRIVHSVIAEVSGVSSASTGYEPHRRVVIKTPTSKPPSGGNNKGRRNGGKSERREKPQRRESNDRDRKSSGESRRQAEPQQEPTSSQPIVTPETKGTTPLYGKVDLD